MEQEKEFYKRNNIVVRWVLGIIILLIVFWLGFRLGEVKAVFSGNAGYFGYGPSMMRGYGNLPMGNMMYRMMGPFGGAQGGPGFYGRDFDDYYYGYGPGMMNGYWNYPFPSATTTPR